MPTDEPDQNAVLAACRNKIRRLAAQRGLGSKALGVPDLDQQLWRWGRDWMAAHRSLLKTHRAGESGATAGPVDVYLATQIFEFGGHTPLIGDFVRALHQPSDGAGAVQAQPHLILTCLDGQIPDPVPEALAMRTGIPADFITVLDGASLADRLEQLFTRLSTLHPDRLFLFHHPDDPLASVVAQVEIARQCVLVHHADSTPSFGLHIPGMQLIDLNPVAAALSRALGLAPALLPLTAPDPGPRPAGFLQRGRLVTATSGTASKFSAAHFYTYPETVRVILQSTGGWHVHIGPLPEPMLREIAKELAAAGVPQDRFVHVPWTTSLAATLWEHGCDVYFSSFPIDGARTDAEVLASATPHLRYTLRPDPDIQRCEIGIEGGMVWRTWQDLSAVLQGNCTAEVLEEKSRLARGTYEKYHHAEAFARHLSRILAGHGGVQDPQQHERDHWALHSMLKSSITAIDHLAEHAGATDAALEKTIQSLNLQAADLKGRIAGQQKRIDFLQRQRRRLRDKLQGLLNERAQWRTGRSFPARILRWLFRS